MSKKLVIVESPAKAKSIGKILGSGYVVKSSVGHIRDLPERTLGVDIKNNFEPKYVLSKGKTKVVAELKKAAKVCSEVYLAPDPDREGEAIAWHLREVLLDELGEKPCYRIQYNEITARAVRAALDKPGSIAMPRVEAQQARRLLDRIVGYKVSPMLWRRIKKGLSAGRVQSVALRLVAEREREIQAFQAVEYWIMGAQVRRTSEPLDPFKMRLARIDGKKPEINAQECAQQHLAALDGCTLKVVDIKQRESMRRALPPFITSSLQQAASSVCHFSPSRTMGLAQKLYEGIDLGSGAPVGLITYMRTDSFNIARDAAQAAQQFIIEKYGDEYYPAKPNFYKSRAGAQEAHEAIRPTDVTITPASLKGKLEAPALRLYELIWKRFVASQMAPARIAQLLVEGEPQASTGEHRYLFTVSASEILFPGFLKVMALDIRKKRKGEEEETDDESDEVDKLPPLAIGDPLHVLEWLSERKETKPPARYSEAALIRALETNGVGRPSTYASIIETLNSRDYTTHVKRQLMPTELGLQVNDLLVDKLDELFNVSFTANMEDQLDKVEEGSIEWSVMLADFYKQFEHYMERVKEPPADKQKVVQVLGLLGQVQEWRPAIKRGKRTYSDEKFVTSVGEQLEAGEKAITNRQLLALAKIAITYRAQIANGEGSLIALGFEEELQKDKKAPSHEEALRRFDVLDSINLSENQQDFVNSLRHQTETGRKLSPRQMAALDQIVIQNANQIEDFAQLQQKLKLAETAIVPEVDEESPLLLEMLKEVQQWQEPVTRGKNTFDDHAFFVSVTEQYEWRKSLSPRQRYALKRLIGRYKTQISDFEKRAEHLGLQKSKPKSKGKGQKKA